jgi:hypothetical protein
MGSRVYYLKDTISLSLPLRQKANIVSHIGNNFIQNKSYGITIYLNNVNQSYDQNPSNDTISGKLFIDSIPTLSFTSIPFPCDKHGKLRMNFVKSSGSYQANGNFITNGYFDPQLAGIGIHRFFYTASHSINNCQEFLDSSLEVKESANLILTDTVLCERTGQAKLNHGKPSGGTYHGNNLNNGIFDTDNSGSGKKNFYYKLKSSNGCIDSLFAVVNVNVSPTIDLGNDTIYCANQILKLNYFGSGMRYWSTGERGFTISIKNTSGKYWLRVESANGCIATDTILVTYDPNCVGLNNHINPSYLFRYFPNPSSGQLTVEFNNVNGEVRLSILNVDGNIVKKYRWNVDENSRKEVNLHDVSNGIYFFDLQTPLGRSIERVTISR